MGKTNLFCSDINTDTIDSNKKAIDAKRPLSPNLVRQLKDDLVIRWTYNSNAIEGNTLTISETKAVLENGITIRGKSLREHLEAINHKFSIDYIETLLIDGIPLSENEIKSLHKLVLTSIDNKNAGKYRRGNVFIGGASHTPPHYGKVPEKMTEMMQEYRTTWQNLHPLVRACFLHGEFVKIHPFIDGNGRTARLIMNFELMKSGYSPIVIKRETRDLYYDALDKGAVTGDYSDFVNHAIQLETEMQNLYLSLLYPDKRSESTYTDYNGICQEDANIEKTAKQKAKEETGSFLF